MSDLNVEELRRKNQATVEKFFHSNFAEQMELFTDDGSFEMGFTEPLMKSAGKAALRERARNAESRYRDWRYLKLNINATLDPNKFFVEVEGTTSGLVRPGLPDLKPTLPNRYIFIFIMEDGRIKRLIEHFDRLFAMQALGMEVPQFP